jgi:hypothetical protein
MKLFQVITVLISLLITQVNANEWSKKPNELDDVLDSMPYPTFFTDDIRYSLMMFGWRNSQYMRLKLNKDEKKLHKSAVFFALENAENGKIVSWYSKDRLANGKVRVVHSYPVGAGHCRTYQSYIKIQSSEKHTTNIACKEDGFQSWRFYR